MASSEERRDEPAKEMVYKTKLIQFLGRSTPIILQNDNGPCPLLAICNVLLLKNNLNLGPDIPEVSQEKLLSLVAERLIDSNSNVNNKDAGYVENQQQNIADAIDLLPRLATGIDVNIKFRRFDDFEFTPECAIFDLLDIPLYHGWIVDPQDYDTMNAIGSKSYNTLMGELVALETRNMENEQKNSEDNSIDFAAATTAALGVPSPCLSRGRSFDDSLNAISGDNKLRKGDVEEEAELLRVLKLSKADLLTSENDPPAAETLGKNTYPNSEEGAHLMKSEALVLVETLEGCRDGESQKSYLLESSLTHHSDARSNPSNEDEVITREVVPMEPVFSKTDQINHNNQCSFEETGKCIESKGVGEESSVDVSVQNENAPSDSSKLDPTSVHMHESSGNEFQKQSSSTSDIHGLEDNKCSYDPVELLNLSPLHADSDSHSSRKQHTDIPDVPDAFTSSANGSEPIYEGEECILESGVKVYEDREPMYEGEVVLAGKVDGCTGDTCDANAKDEVSPRQGELIRSFLKNNASQLTIYGLFCLQDGLKERELCVFFRNNHFNTMFKYDGELYILATDQGYINQPDLVWEKLNEVNGNTVFMTGSFKQFKVENQTSNTWDEQNAMATTADYLANIDNSANVNSSFNSDLQLAIALQQQEFEQQPQRNVQQPTVSTSSSRLVTGPQVPRNNGKMPSLSSKQDAKSSKEKCTVM